MEPPMRAQVFCFGAIERRSRAHCKVVECCSVTLLSASSAVSAGLRCERQAVSTAERAELWGEGHGVDEGPDAWGLRHRAPFEVSS
jgi:hypothetical protein